MGEAMNPGLFMKFLALCGYPQRFRSPFLVDQSGVPRSVTGTTALTTLYTITIPANSVGPNGRLRLTVLYNNLVGRIGSWSPSATFAGIVLFNAVETTAIGSFAMTVDIFASNNSVTTQVAAPFGTTGANGTSVRGYGANMAQVQTIQLQGTLANAADTMTLTAFSLEVLNP
ncbi:hypothetical protein P3T40_002005 [Paraburkholderia sp. EB58]|uniref:hypothetical protein n=1 Tax=Paraburkholderia sp. EB58 TaxID=3035125 RepID=UPI003D1BFDDE